MIDKTEDENMLKQAYFLLEDSALPEKEKRADWWDELSLTHQKQIEQALEESENEANYLKNEEVQQEADKWIKE